MQILAQGARSVNLSYETRTGKKPEAPFTKAQGKLRTPRKNLAKVQNLRKVYALDVSSRPNLFAHKALDDVNWHCHPKVGTGHHGVDAEQAAARINERPARIAGTQA